MLDTLCVALISHGRCNSTFLALKLSVMSLQILNTTTELLQINTKIVCHTLEMGIVAQPWHFLLPTKSKFQTTPSLQFWWKNNTSVPQRRQKRQPNFTLKILPLRRKIQMESFILWQRNVSTIFFVGVGLMPIQICWVEIPHSSSGLMLGGDGGEQEVEKYRN